MVDSLSALHRRIVACGQGMPGADAQQCAPRIGRAPRRGLDERAAVVIIIAAALHRSRGQQLADWQAILEMALCEGNKESTSCCWLVSASSQALF